MLSGGHLIAILSSGLLVIVWMAFTVWIVRDARGSAHPFLWAVCAPLGGILYYVFWWRRHHDRTDPRSRREYYAQVVAVAGIGGVAISAVVSPPDPIAQLVVWPITFTCCLPVAYLLINAGQPKAPNTA